MKLELWNSGDCENGKTENREIVNSETIKAGNQDKGKNNGHQIWNSLIMERWKIGLSINDLWNNVSNL